MADNAPNQHAIQDPLQQYPKPDYPKQPQDAPGLAREMTPQPDHGEKSYKGCGRLAGRKALVTGGDSGIGRAAAIAFAREGADVVIGYLPQEQPDADEVIKLIEAEGRKAIACPGDLSQEDECKKLIETAVKELGGLDLVAIVAAKQVAVENISDITTEQFDRTFRTNV
ncbi:MAG TPA: SDR family NAD(P)-dependent oxidoreductase, partial [Candidatus Limnocylindrales bacterium]|nr:SDR family NAD(P)-dependent oxidoreductase [Candidatus Limnocylindrales bacterium]